MYRKGRPLYFIQSNEQNLDMKFFLCVYIYFSLYLFSEIVKVCVVFGRIAFMKENDVSWKLPTLHFKFLMNFAFFSFLYENLFKFYARNKS